MPTYIITGANRGLGLEFVNQLSTDSSAIIIASTRSLTPTTNANGVSPLQGLHDLQKSPTTKAQIHILECDTSSAASISKFAAEVTSFLSHGPNKTIDFLLNSAGINSVPEQTALTLTAEGLNTQMNTNVLGPALTVQALQPLLGAGSVVMNMTSGLASIAYNRTKDPTEATAYSISKVALNMLTVHQADALKASSVVVFCMDPGWVVTDMGGANAPLTKDVSIKGMLKFLQGVGMEQSGRFFQYDGEERLW